MDYLTQRKRVERCACGQRPQCVARPGRSGDALRYIAKKLLLHQGPSFLRLSQLLTLQGQIQQLLHSRGKHTNRSGGGTPSRLFCEVWILLSDKCLQLLRVLLPLWCGPSSKLLAPVALKLLETTYPDCWSQGPLSLSLKTVFNKIGVEPLIELGCLLRL